MRKSLFGKSFYAGSHDSSLSRSPSSSSCLCLRFCLWIFVQCLSNQTNQLDQASNIVYSQTNPSYTTVLRAYIRNSRFNTSTTPKPIIIVTLTQESHVQATVICTKNIGIQPKIQSGSHDYEGISYILDVRFIILDMFNLQSTTKGAKSGLKREKPTIK